MGDAGKLTAHSGITLAAPSVFLATVAPLSYIMRGGPGGRLETNFFGMVVGRQGYERKSTATGLAVRLLEQALPVRVGLEPGSGEGFVQGLADNPQQLLEMSEYGDFPQ